MIVLHVDLEGLVGGSRDDETLVVPLTVPPLLHHIYIPHRHNDKTFIDQITQCQIPELSGVNLQMPVR